MAHSYHHAISSARKWGGTPEDYLPVHKFLDSSKLILADFRHRSLLHHSAGCFLAEMVIGNTIRNASGRVVPVRIIAEQHIAEDIGFIPSFVDWVRCIKPEAWMGRAGCPDIAEAERSGVNDRSEIGDV